MHVSFNPRGIENGHNKIHLYVKLFYVDSSIETKHLKRFGMKNHQKIHLIWVAYNAIYPNDREKKGDSTSPWFAYSLFLTPISGNASVASERLGFLLWFINDNVSSAENAYTNLFHNEQ